MKKLRIDNKWSVEYDPTENDSPKHWYRYDEDVKSPIDNIHVALFYALLDARNSVNDHRGTIEALADTTLRDMREIARLRGLLQWRQSAGHAGHCAKTFYKGECDCGLDAVAAYFKEIGE